MAFAAMKSSLLSALKLDCLIPSENTAFPRLYWMRPRGTWRRFETSHICKVTGSYLRQFPHRMRHSHPLNRARRLNLDLKISPVVASRQPKRLARRNRLRVL